jgi:hypothetical protein
MFDDMGELEILTRMEKIYGPLSKRLPEVYTTDAVDKIQAELMQLIQKYKSEFSIKDNIPRIRSWIEQNTVKFVFFDRHTGKRVILGEWFAKAIKEKDRPYDH